MITTGRISATFRQLQQESRTGFIPYFTVGYPTLAETPGLVRAAIAGGATVVELGVPFSDPMADGVTIQRSDQVALEQGITLKDCLEVARGLRSEGIDTPLVLMGYYNNFLSYGLPALARAAVDAGVDGFIVVDLPPEEAADFQAAIRPHSLDLVFLLAPTSTDQRIAEVGAQGSGFVYCVSVTGVTGERGELPSTLVSFIKRVRAGTDLPVAVGFGISTRAHVQTVGQVADAAVVGSALIRIIGETPAGQRDEAVRRFVSELTGANGA